MCSPRHESVVIKRQRKEMVGPEGREEEKKKQQERPSNEEQGKKERRVEKG